MNKKHLIISIIIGLSFPLTLLIAKNSLYFGWNSYLLSDYFKLLEIDSIWLLLIGVVVLFIIPALYILGFIFVVLSTYDAYKNKQDVVSTFIILFAVTFFYPAYTLFDTWGEQKEAARVIAPDEGAKALEKYQIELAKAISSEKINGIINPHNKITDINFHYKKYSPTSSKLKNNEEIMYIINYDFNKSIMEFKKDNYLEWMTNNWHKIKVTFKPDIVYFIDEKDKQEKRTNGLTFCVLAHGAHYSCEINTTKFVYINNIPLKDYIKTIPKT